jgi:hypothetical protein
MSEGKRREVSDGSEGLRYHSSREERTGGREPAKPRGGILRHNRSLAIVLIDVIFVFVVFLLFRFLTAGDPTSASLAGVDFSLDAFEFDDEIYLTVTASTREERSPIEESPRVFTVRFPDGSKVSDVLPTAPTMPVEVRAVVPAAVLDASDRERGVTVEIEAADEELELFARVD